MPHCFPVTIEPLHAHEAEMMLSADLIGIPEQEGQARALSEIHLSDHRRPRDRVSQSASPAWTTQRATYA